jgi:hypothetical protein
MPLHSPQFKLNSTAPGNRIKRLGKIKLNFFEENVLIKVKLKEQTKCQLFKTAGGL